MVVLSITKLLLLVVSQGVVGLELFVEELTTPLEFLVQVVACQS